jgi:hypothetical protein
MSRRAATALVAAAALVLIGTLVWLGRARPPEARRPLMAAGERFALPGVPDDEPRERQEVTLWLPAAHGRIAPLAVEIESPPERRARLVALVASLLAQPPTAELDSVFPAPVALRALVLAPDGTVYLDLGAEEGGAPPAAGSTLEQQRIWAIVHTLLRNEPRAERVVLLWNGEQRPSLSGHVDTGRALGLRPELEARP